MLLRFLPESLFDERVLGSDAPGVPSAISGFRIELDRVSWGQFTSFETRDVYGMTLGVGTFELFVTSDLLNSYGSDAVNTAFDVKIIDANGTLIFSSLPVGPDINTRQLVFTSNTTDTLYVQIDNLSGRGLGYLATVRTSAGQPVLSGTAGADTLIGTAAGETISAGSGADSVSGREGNDVIDGGAGANYLRGDEGNDNIIGGADFDDINGNMGDDTASGGLGDDWVVGGKDNDNLRGDDGADLVYGNLGSDTLDGGAGNDVVRGGQDLDLLFGGAGNDFLSGDKGDDTMTGGSGADIFHTFGDAGLDVVVDFSRIDGDRIMVDPGTVYTVTQAGPNIEVNMVGGAKLVILNLTIGQLPDGWIFGA